MEIDNQLQDIIPYIKEDTKFWFVRSMTGYFYDEFIKNEFVALGWNIINKKNLGQNENKLKELLKHHYPEQSKPGLALNKCIKFYQEMRAGDIIILPSSKSQFITFAVVGEYYEIENLDKEIEDEAVKKINAGADSIGTIYCPFRKRRKIKVLKTVEGKNLDARLQNALSSYHGVSSLDEYAEIILGTIFNLFYYKEKYSLTIDINREESISPKNLGRFLYRSYSYLDQNYEDESISSKMTLNSPGQIAIVIADQTYNIGTAIPLILFATYIAIAGFKIKDLEVNPLLDCFYKFADRKNSKKEKVLSIESMELDNEGKSLDNTMKKLEIIKTLAENQTHIEMLESINKDAKYLRTSIDSKIVYINDFYKDSTKSDQQE